MLRPRRAVDGRFARLAAVQHPRVAQHDPRRIRISSPPPLPFPLSPHPLLVLFLLRHAPLPHTAVSSRPSRAWAVDNVIYTGRVINVLGDRRFKKAIGNRRQRRATVSPPPAGCCYCRMTNYRARDRCPGSFFFLLRFSWHERTSRCDALVFTALLIISEEDIARRLRYRLSKVRRCSFFQLYFQ